MAKSEKDRKDRNVKAARSGIIYIMGQVVASFSVLVLLVLIARLLKPSQFGLYAIVIAFYTLLGIASTFGVGTTVRKKIPEMKTKEQLSALVCNAYVLSLAIAVIIMIFGVVFSNAIAVYVYHQPEIGSALQLASVLVIFWAFFNLTIAVLVGLDRVKEATMIDLLYSILQPIMAVSLVLLGYGVFGAIAGIAISIVVGSALGLYYLSRHITKIVRPTKRLLKEIFGFSTPIATSNIAFLGPSNFAILLLGAYASSVIVGNYNAGYEIGNFVGIIFTSATFVLLPYFATRLLEKRGAKRIGSIYNSTVYYTLLFLLPTLAFVVGIAKPLMFLFFSRVYAMTPFYFSAIALGTTLGIFGAYAGTLIIAYGDAKRFMVYQLAVVAIEIVLLFLLTPIFKGIGVLVSIFLIGPLVLDIIYIMALRRQFAFRPEFGKLIPLVLAAGLTFVLLYSVTFFLHQSKWSIPIDLFLAILVYIPLLAAFRGFSRNELDFLERISSSYKLDFIAKYIFGYAQFFIRKRRPN